MINFIKSKLMSSSNVVNIDPTEFSSKIREEVGNFTIIDCRTEREFKQGHIESALNYDIFNSNFASQIQESVSLDKDIYIYCLSGGRSSGAAKIVESLGYKSIYNMSGGFNRWLSNNLPTTIK